MQSQIEPYDLRERGAKLDDQPQYSERRLYGQLQVFTGCYDANAVKIHCEQAGLDGALYMDVQDPQGIGVVAFSEDPTWFVAHGRNFFNSGPFVGLTRKPEFTLFGRSYATGHEPQLEDWLINKPRRLAMNPEWPWAVWYPLRRKPEFALLEPAEQGKVLLEHARTGMAFGQAGHAADIRLACYGLDTHDNEFVLGLVGPELYPLSRLVQEMRKSQQTAKYLASLGPFFVGKVYWQAPYHDK